MQRFYFKSVFLSVTLTLLVAITTYADEPTSQKAEQYCQEVITRVQKRPFIPLTWEGTSLNGYTAVEMESFLTILRVTVTNHERKAPVLEQSKLIQVLALLRSGIPEDQQGLGPWLQAVIDYTDTLDHTSNTILSVLRRALRVMGKLQDEEVIMARLIPLPEIFEKLLFQPTLANILSFHKAFSSFIAMSLLDKDMAFFSDGRYDRFDNEITYKAKKQCIQALKLNPELLSSGLHAIMTQAALPALTLKDFVGYYHWNILFRVWRLFYQGYSELLADSLKNPAAYNALKVEMLANLGWNESLPYSALIEKLENLATRGNAPVHQLAFKAIRLMQMVEKNFEPVQSSTRLDARQLLATDEIGRWINNFNTAELEHETARAEKILRRIEGYQRLEAEEQLFGVVYPMSMPR